MKYKNPSLILNYQIISPWSTCARTPPYDKLSHSLHAYLPSGHMRVSFLTLHLSKQMWCTWSRILWCLTMPVNLHLSGSPRSTCLKSLYADTLFCWVCVWPLASLVYTYTRYTSLLFIIDVYLDVRICVYSLISFSISLQDQIDDFSWTDQSCMHVTSFACKQPPTYFLSCFSSCINIQVGNNTSFGHVHVGSL